MVLDTHIVISALLFTRGPAVRGRQAWHAGQLLPLAAAGRADALVSGDADLLALAGQTRWRILTLAKQGTHLAASATPAPTPAA